MHGFDINYIGQWLQCYIGQWLQCCDESVVLCRPMRWSHWRSWPCFWRTAQKIRWRWQSVFWRSVARNWRRSRQEELMVSFGNKEEILKGGCWQLPYLKVNAERNDLHIEVCVHSSEWSIFFLFFFCLLPSLFFTCMSACLESGEGSLRNKFKQKNVLMALLSGGRFPWLNLF